MPKFFGLAFLAAFLLLFSSALQAQGLLQGPGTDPNKNPLPSDARLLQEALWKDYRLKLLLSPTQPYLRGPADFFIEAKKDIMKSPFAGAISVGFENISKSSSLQETQIGAEDFEEDGLAKLSHSFTEPGDYAVTVSFTDPTGDLFLLRGELNIPKESLWAEHRNWIMSGGGLAALILLLALLQRKKPKHP